VTIKKKLLQWALPMNSNRRMIGRLLKQVAYSPATLNARINRENLVNFLHYRKYSFQCPVCGHQTTPLYDFPNLELRRQHKIGVLRETLQCKECFASMRQRSLALALLQFWYRRTAVRHESIAALADAGLGDISLLDTDNFSAISTLLRGVSGYTRCSYLPDKPYGEIEPNYYNINLERVDFCDASFDVVLTSDVMEHVRNSDAAHAEIERILIPGGAYIFNIPYDEGMEDDIQLVDTSSPEDRYLCEPQYHGDPLTGEILAYRVFGRKLLTKLSGLGFQVHFQRIEEPASLVTDGDVFVAIKKD
jgi:hypothetical protein